MKRNHISSLDNSEKKSADQDPQFDIVRPEKRFVRYREGAELYGMSLKTFERLAREAKATYKVGRMVLVNCRYFEEYLEQFRIE